MTFKEYLLARIKRAEGNKSVLHHSPYQEGQIDTYQEILDIMDLLDAMKDGFPVFVPQELAEDVQKVLEEADI